MKCTILSIAMVALLGTGIASVTLAQKPEHAGSGKGVMKDEAPVIRETEQSREKYAQRHGAETGDDRGAATTA